MALEDMERPVCLAPGRKGLVVLATAGMVTVEQVQNIEMVHHQAEPEQGERICSW